MVEINAVEDSAVRLSNFVELGERLAAVTHSGQLSIEEARGALHSVLRDQPVELHASFLNQLSARHGDLVAAGAPHQGEHGVIVAELAHWIGVAHHDRGKRLKIAGRPQEAEEAFRLSLAAWEQLGATDHARVVEGDLGAALRQQNRLIEAEPLLRRALAAAAAAQHHHNELGWRLELGNTLCFMARHDEAEEVARTGLSLARRQGKVSHAGGLLTVLANVAENRGHYDESLRLHRQALGLSQQLDDPEAEALDHKNLGNLAHRFHRRDEALEAYARGYELARRSGNVALQVEMATSLGGAMIASGEIAQGVGLLSQAQSHAEELGLTYSLLRIYGNLAATLGSSDPQRARLLLERSHSLSQRLGDRPSQAKDVIDLVPLLLEAGETAEARRLLAQKEIAPATLEDPFLSARLYGMSARLAVVEGEADEVVWEFHARAMAALEQPRGHVRRDQDRIGLYTSSHREIYRSAVGWCLDRDLWDRAFETAERSKARLLLDALDPAAAASPSPPPTTDALLGQLRSLPPSTAVVSLFHLEEREEVVLFLLRGGAREVTGTLVPLPAIALTEWRRRWSELLAGDDPQPWTRSRAEEALRRLDELLVAPIRRWLGQGEPVDQLLLVPSGELRGLPLHLAVGEGSGRTLAEELLCIYVPALQLMHGEEIGAATGVTTEDILVVHDPSLEHAGREADGLVERFGARRLAEGGNLGAALDQAAPSILHLACHGRFEPARPEASYLRLPGGTPLTVAEISGWRLPRLDLVVASACHSAATAQAGLDEALGLSRGWLLAGARHLLDALWQVDDRSSARFMAAFYGELADGAASAAAFRAAQRALRGGDPIDRDPRVWGAFTWTTLVPGGVGPGAEEGR